MSLDEPDSEDFIYQKNPDRIKKVFVPQYDDLDCGPAALSMITASLGNQIPVSEIKKFIETTQNGSTLYGIVSAAHHFKLKTCAIETDYDELSKLRMPAIAHLKGTSDQFTSNIDHYVVIYQVKKDQVTIADPAHGILKLNQSEFRSRWSGVFLLFQSSSEFKNLTFPKTDRISIKSLFFEYKNHLLKIFVISALITGLAQIPTRLMGKIVDLSNVDVSSNLSLIRVLALSILFSKFISLMSRFLRDYVNIRFATKLDFGLSYLIHSKLMSLRMKDFSNKKSGDLVSRSDSVSDLDLFLSGILVSTVMDMFMAVSFFVSLYLIHPTFGLLAFASLVLMGAVSYLIANWVRKSTYTLINHGNSATTAMIQNIRYLPVIKSLGNESLFLKFWSFKAKKLLRVHSKFRSSFNGLKSIESLLEILIEVTVIFLGIQLLSEGAITLGQLIIAQTFMDQFLGPVYGLTRVYDDFQKSKINIERANDLLNLDSEIDGSLCPDLNGAIEIRNLSFSYYPQSGKKVIDRFNAKIDPGKLALLVGKSGSGKSTLIQLLLRLYEPDSGSIRIDGSDIRKLELSFLRKKIGYVSQEPLLLPLSIGQNISLGEANPDPLKIEEALKLANGLDFVNGLPRGLDTIISEDGKGLSGGQKQRIALARALYRNPTILLLDEPTSALDRESELAFIDVIKKIKGDKTILICTHKKEVFDFADEILVLHEGKADETL